jgi:hypothetical protein
MIRVIQQYQGSRKTNSSPLLVVNVEPLYYGVAYFIFVNCRAATTTCSDHFHVDHLHANVLLFKFK